MSISFPTSPTAGQIYQNWVWNASAGTWDAVSPGLTVQLRRQVFTGNGTYTPSPGMFQADVEVLAGGGAGGGSAVGTANTFSVGGGGGAGSYSKRLCTAAQVGASQAVTIGAGGLAATGATAGPGGNGGNSSFGSLVTSNGGIGGIVGGTSMPAAATGNALGGAAGTGDIAIAGASGGPITYTGSASVIITTGLGASAQYGAGGRTFTSQTNGPANGEAAKGYGAGGGGGSVFNTGYGQAQGGNGAPGLCLVTEYCWITQAAVAAQAASGARVLLSSQTVSTPVASVDFTQAGWLDDTTTDSFELEIVGASNNAAAAASPGLRVSQNFGSTWDAGNNYAYAFMVGYSDNTSTNSGANASSYIVLGTSEWWATNPADHPLSGTIRLWRPWSTVLKTCRYDMVGYLAAAGQLSRWSGAGSYGYQGSIIAAPYNSLRFFWTSGNVYSGTFNLYKIVR